MSDRLSPHALVQANRPLAYHIARKLYRSLRCVRRLGIEEARSAALFGLVKASRGFDPTRGNGFSTYAYASIQHSILAEANQAGLPVRLPVYLVDYDNLPYESRPKLARAAEHVHAKLVSLSIPGGLAARSEPHDRSPAAADMLEAAEQQMVTQARIQQALSCLTPRQREVIELRYWQGLNGPQTGKVIGLSRERVRQIEKSAVAKLRRTLAGVEIDR